MADIGNLIRFGSAADLMSMGERLQASRYADARDLGDALVHAARVAAPHRQRAMLRHEERTLIELGCVDVGGEG